MVGHEAVGPGYKSDTWVIVWVVVSVALLVLVLVILFIKLVW
jgi:hypothetical protein